MHLPEHAARIAHIAQCSRAERDIDRCGRQEGEIGEIAVTELNATLFFLDEPARVSEVVGRLVDADDLRSA